MSNRPAAVIKLVSSDLKPPVVLFGHAAGQDNSKYFVFNPFTQIYTIFGVWGICATRQWQYT